MITFPTVLTYKDVAVYPDDKDCNLYYCIKTTPSIRTVNGEPVFNGLFWTDKADNAEASVSGFTGGKVNFDINLQIPDKDLEEIRQKIKSSGIQKQRYNEISKKENHRRTNILKSANDNGSPADSTAEIVDNIPAIAEVRFGSIEILNSSVDVLENGELIAKIPNLYASNLGDNNSAIALDLNAKGAAVWYKALEKDEMAIGVRINLTFPVRLPNLEIHAYAASLQRQELHQKIEQIEKKYKDRCGVVKTDYIDTKAITRELVDNRIFIIDIDEGYGSTSIPKEYVTQIREMVIEMIEKKVEEMFKTRLEGFSLKEEDNDYFLASAIDEVNSFMDLHFSETDAVNWTVSPQCTMTEFLSKFSKDARKRATMMVDLAEVVAETANVDITVNAPWDEAPYFTSVYVELTCLGNNEVTSHTFTKNASSWRWTFRGPGKGKSRKIKYNVYASMANVAEPYKILNQFADGLSSINIALGKVGVIDIPFEVTDELTALRGKNAISCIEVILSYTGKNKKQYFEETIVLDTDKRKTETFHAELGVDIDEPVICKEIYHFKEKDTIVLPEKNWYRSKIQIENKIPLMSPFPGKKNISVSIPIPGTTLSKVDVDFKYIDEKEDFECCESVILESGNNWTAKAVLQTLSEATKGNYQYKFTAYGKDYKIEQGWTTGDGDTLHLPIEVIQFSTALLFNDSEFTMGTLRIMEEKNNFDRSFFLTKENSNGMLDFFVRKFDDNPCVIKYVLKLFRENGSTVEESGSWTEMLHIFIKPTAVPEQPKTEES